MADTTVARDTRLAILNDSDAVCDSCGRDPRMTAATEAAFLDGAWTVDIYPVEGSDEYEAGLLCRTCLAEAELDA